MATIWASLEASGGTAGRARFGFCLLGADFPAAPFASSVLFRFFGAMLRLGTEGSEPGCLGAAAFRIWILEDLPIKIH